MGVPASLDRAHPTGTVGRFAAGSSLLESPRKTVMSTKANAVDEMTRRVLEIVYPDGIFPTDYPKAIGIVSMIALSTDGILAKPAHPIPSPTPRERERRRAEAEDGAPAEEPGSRRAAWDRAVARSQIGQRRDNPAGGADGQHD